MTLRARIALIAAAAVAVAVLAASAGAYVAARNELIGQVDKSLAERAGLIGPLPTLRSLVDRNRPGRGMAGMDQSIPRSDFDQVYVQLVLRSGIAIYPAENDVPLPVSEQDLAVAARTSLATFRDVTVDDLHLRMVTAPAGQGEAIQVARPLTEVDATLGGLAVLLGAVGLGGVALAGLLGTVVARGALRPIARLTSAAEHVAETQELAARIDVDRQDEIGRLASSFNAMLAALEESKDQQRRLVHDASHELRTPLTALRTNIELLARRSDMPAADRDRLMQDVTVELEELSTLVSELVDLATDARVSDEPVVALRLDQLVERVVERARRRTGRTVPIVATPVEIKGRAALLERAVGNLLENAEKWSPAGAPIEVYVENGRVAVVDHGPGIGADDLPHIFERFYRAPAARALPGSGLGLAIVKQIVEEGGGTVFATHTPGGGATVGFEIPVIG